MTEPKHVAIIGAALDLGSGRRRLMGRSAIRYAGLEERLPRDRASPCFDWGNVETAVVEAHPRSAITRARYLPEIKAACARVSTLSLAGGRRGRASRSFSAATTPSRWAR